MRARILMERVVEHTGYVRWFERSRRMLDLPADAEARAAHLKGRGRGAAVGVCAAGALALFAGRVAVLVLLAAGGYALWPDLKMHRRTRRMARSIRRAFGGMVNTLIIYLQSGYPVEGALRQAAQNGAPDDLKRLFHQAFARIDNGQDRVQGLRQVVHKAQDPFVSKLVFVLEQGMRIGKAGVLDSLASLADQAQREEADRMRMDGARASAKMVFPMMLMFLAVALLALAPGLLALNGAL